MCGRYTLTIPVGKLADLFDLPDVPDLSARYNVAPSQAVPVVRLRPDGTREVAMLRWGLIPSWAKDAGIAQHTINARSETAATKPAFRAAFKDRRCLIPADGFFEWQKTEGGKKQPYYFQVQGGRPFAFAGLWEEWHAPDGEIIESCSILTTTANDLLKSMHERMPVILHPEDYAAWLSPAASSEQLHALLKSFPAGEMVAQAVGTFVNNPRNDGPRCVAPPG